MKTLKNYAVLLFIVSIILSACQSKEKGSHAKLVEVNGNKLIDCNISEVTDIIDVLLSELVHDCQIVPLETNDSSLFESVYHIGVSDNYIAIHSRGKMPIKLFNRQGKFIRNIGKIGRGPGEFNSLYGIQLDEAAKRIYLSPFARATKLIVYSLDNESMPDIPLAYQQTKFQAHVENDVVTVLAMPFQVKDQAPNPIAFQQTTDGKIIKEYRGSKHLVINPVNEKGQFVGFNSEISSSHNAGAHDMFTLTHGNAAYDTLYHYNTRNNTLEPKYVASFMGEKHGSWSRELKSHFWTIVFGNKYKGKKVIVNKKTLKSDFFHLKNDYYGNIELHKFYMSNNGYFVAGIQAIQLMENFKEALGNPDLDAAVKKKIEKELARLNENDNEVLFIGKMK